MNQRWLRIQEIFHAALDQPHESRGAFVRERCAGDADLLAQVESLLREEPGSDDFLEPPSVAPGASRANGAGAQPLGRRLGDFELLSVLGRGGMGVVHLARQVSLDRLAAVKLLPGARWASPEAAERFRREARAAARLRHPGIVPILSFGEEDGDLYYAMEYVEGWSVKQLLDAAAAGDPATRPAVDLRDPRACAAIAAKIADALQYSHDEGIVHRDVKPQNVLIDVRGEPRLVDFGIARDLELTPLTRSGEFTGTPHYMSPEQADRQHGPVDHRTDVYSLAIVLYQMLAGSVPFAGDSNPAILYNVVYARARPVRERNPRVPEDLATICEKGMSRRSADRYATAAEFAADLRRFLNGEPIHARPPGPIARIRNRFSDRRTLVKALPVALGGGLLLGIVAYALRADAIARADRPLVRVVVAGAADATVWARRLAKDGWTFEPPREIGATRDGRLEARLDGGTYAFLARSDHGAVGETTRELAPRTESIAQVTLVPADAEGGRMARIEAGEHRLLGSGDVRVPSQPIRHGGYEIDRQTVTNGEIRSFHQRRGDWPPRHWPKEWAEAWAAPPRVDWLELPAVHVTWRDAHEYAAGIGKRLPTYLEWERAMTGPDGGGWIESVKERLVLSPGPVVNTAITLQGYVDHVRPSRLEAKDAFGPHSIFHPLGNVFEWTVLDEPHVDASGHPVSTSSRIVAGAAWVVGRDLIGPTRFGLASVARGDTGSVSIGFRCARSLFP